MALDTTAREDAEEDQLLLWILVWSELIAFGILLMSFLVISVVHADTFALARLHLRPGLAAMNTVILLLSGYQVAVASRRRNNLTHLRRPLVVAALLGLAFVAVKLFEYRAEARYASDAVSGTFFELYFIVTGFHLLHVFFGALVLCLVAWRPSRENVLLISTLWHVIDLVWLVMFPILYLA